MPFSNKKLDAVLSLKNITKQDLAKSLNMSPSTLFRKLNNPNIFTLEDINNCINKLGEKTTFMIFFDKEE